MAMIAGYAQNGRVNESLEVYAEMVQYGWRQDYVSLMGLLFACSHTDLVGAGRAVFGSMEDEHGVAIRIRAGPLCVHVDLLGRAMRLAEVMDQLCRSKTRLDASVQASARLMPDAPERGAR
ncbi:hypothetical protein ACQ4PT_047761 [Festuca glaucescens]